MVRATLTVPRLWVFNQHYAPDALATAQILEPLCVGLAKLGWDVTVFTGRPFLLPAGVDWQPGTDAEFRRGVRVVRLPSWNRRHGTLGRLAHYGLYAIGAALQWTRDDPPHVALCLTTPPVLAGIVGVLGNLLRGVPFVYNTQDLFPDILASSAYAGTWIERCGGAMASIVERRAARIVTIGAQMQQQLAQRGIPPEKLTCIENAVDVTKVTPIAATDNPWLQHLHIPQDTFRVVYAGNFGHAQGLETVIAAATLLSSRADIRFFLVGEGDGKAKIAALAQGLPNVSLHPFAAHAAETLSAGHVGLVPLRPHMGNYVLPSKSIHYLAAGTPLVAAAEPGSDVEKLVEGAGCGFTYPAGNAEALAEAIVAAVARKHELADMGLRGRQYVLRHFAGDAIAARYDRLLRDVIDASSFAGAC